MTPDVYTNLRILNCTNFPLETSDVSSYQMESWFPNTSPLVNPQDYSQPYFLQFKRGGGDEDDSANITMIIDTFSIALLCASSGRDSSHSMNVTLTSPGATFPLAVGLVTTADWPQSSELSSLVSWSLPPTSPGQVVNLGPLAAPGTDLGNPNMALAIVDLSQIYSPADVTAIQNAIQGNTLTAQQMVDLWTKVSNYTRIV